MHVARQVRDAERANPGIVDRRIDEMLAEGKAPTKANIYRTALHSINVWEAPRINTQRSWTKGVQNMGWCLVGVDGKDHTFRCGLIGCRGELRAAVFEKVSPCGWDHAGRFSSAVFEEYSDLVDELRQKRHLLGVSQEDVELAAGMAPDHLGKLETHVRIAQFPTMMLWTQTLGYRVTLEPAALPDPMLSVIEGRSGRGLRGGQDEDEDED